MDNRKNFEINSTFLYDPFLLDKISKALSNNNLIVRPLNLKDYDKGFLQLLSELTDVGKISREQFIINQEILTDEIIGRYNFKIQYLWQPIVLDINRFRSMKSNGDYYVIVIEDVMCMKVVGSATLVIEQKFIHNCGLRGRLEDVVVNNEYRGKQLGKIIVRAVIQLAQDLQCYKLSLDCRDRLIPFYESLDFKREAGNANSMNIRFPQKSRQEQSRL